MLGIKHRVFEHAHGHPLLRYVWRRLLRFDTQTGLITCGLPMVLTMAASITVGTLILDRQAEMRYWRKKSLSVREDTLEREHQALREFLKDTEDEYEMVKIPESYRKEVPEMLRRRT
mmetsp:Transcript_31099/g.71063  ORF Transcript_31099/g.71063 Transcript_31099/m.71063 type:complete len:117 (+) Transcript_31099:38-388(+)